VLRLVVLVLKAVLVVFTAAIALVSLSAAVALHSSASWFVGVGLVILAAGFLVYGFSRVLARRSERTFLLLLLAAALVPRIAWVAAVRNEQVSDFAIYHELGLALVSGRGYAVTGPVGVEDIDLYIGGPRALPYTTAFRAPGVSLWSAALYEVFGTSSFVARAANVALGAAAPLLLFLLLRRSMLAEVARPASLAAALYPTSIMATNLVGTEILFSLLLLAAAWMLERSDAGRATASHSRSWLWLAAAGLTAGAAALVRSMLLPLAASFALALGLRHGVRRGGLRAAAVVFCMAVAVAPWTIRNWRVFGRFIPICTDEGMFLATHSAENVPERARTAEWKAAYRRWDALSDEAEKGKEGYALGRANFLAMLGGGPAHVAAVLVRGFRDTFGKDLEILFWTQRRSFLRAVHGSPERLFSPRLNYGLEILVTGCYLAVTMTAVAGALLVDPKRLATSGVLFLAITFLVFTAAHVSLSGQPRYHYWLMPFLITLSALALIPARRGPNPDTLP
jgi:4-amino-4-deoxy-L-arabinose transferase-like glycosyltransferase